jgi:polygalacturonase
MQLMKNILTLIIFILGLTQITLSQVNKENIFPDGTPIPGWFQDTTKVKLSDLGKQFVITNYGAVNDSSVLQTITIQKTIDEASKQGGGVIIIPKGTFLSGALFFKPKTHLHVAEGTVLKGSDNIEDYPKMPSRMEGQNLEYFPALVNAYGVNGFTISGKGTIDGN